MAKRMAEWWSGSNVLRCHSVDGVAMVEYGSDGHFDERMFGCMGEGGLIAIKEAQTSFDFRL